ncbi:trans-Golgi network-localized SYP41-interacting protein 1 isoform X2 [Argentina anserina]|uniref:trans-Golgi network-localized SYP41-interacting protein 1 isoform X2 n=1 Tax=Argentina anserina TaxID=57926 RepID=UPI00217660D4|nr:trans-Golgi network-localized SYP41-interacting protein 1 isoform X2 [Potentilla anserina]
MDKNKSRTDLLAAGRKKLQQYRQKKDKGSGSQGKSSKKSGKSEQHEAAAKPAALSQVHDRETESAVGSNSEVVNTADSDTGVDVVGPSAVPITQEKGVIETESEKNAASTSEEVGISKPDADSSIQNDGENTGTADADVARDISLDTSHTVDSGGGAENVNMSVEDDESAIHTSVDITEGMPMSGESEIPSAVADVGPSVLPITEEKSVVETELEKNAKLPSDKVEDSKPGADSSVPNEGEITGTADAEVARDISLDTAHTVDSRGEAENLSMSEQVAESTQIAPADITEGMSVTVESQIPSSGKESSPEDIITSSVQDREDQIEKHFDTQLQFEYRHNGLLDETSSLHASLDELCEKNQSLAEEFALCRGELQAVAFEKEELGNKFHAAKLEVEEATSRANDLHNNLERAQQDVFRLSTELADCKGLVQALQVENETLNETIVSADEVKSKLTEQNKLYIVENEKLSTDLVDCETVVATLQGQISNLNGSLDSVAHEREHLFCGNEKLTTELAGSKNLISALQAEIASVSGSLGLVTEEKKKLEEERDYSVHENERLFTDLVACEILVATLQGQITQISNLSGNLDSVTQDREDIFCENEKLATELADSKKVASALQEEIASLNGNLALVMEGKKKLEEEREYSVHENERLSTELVVLQERFSAEREERVRFEVDLKETTERLEQLINENISLTSSLDILKAKLSKVENSGFDIPAPAGNQVELSRGLDLAIENDNSQKFHGEIDGEASLLVDKSLSVVGVSPISNIGKEVVDDSDRFIALQGHLEKADKMLYNLVQEVESLCAHSTSLSKSGDKVHVPQVSKMIQAFELKAHSDEHAEGPTLSDDQSPEDTVVSVQGQIGNLRALFTQLLLDAANASLLLKEERDDKKHADATSSELKDQNEALEEYSKKLEATNIELRVLYEALEEHREIIESRNFELLNLCDSLQLEVTNLKAENVEVDRKLHVCESRTSQLQSRLHDLHLISNVMVSQIPEQLEKFHKVAAENVLTLECHWNSTIDPVLQAIGKLDQSLGRVTTTTTVTHNSLDRLRYSVASVQDAISFIQQLKEKLESSQTDHETVSTLFKELNEKYDDLHGKNEMSSELLQKLYGNLSKFVSVLHGSTDESNMYVEPEKLADPLDYSNYATILKPVESFLRGSLQLESVNKKLDSELMARAEEVEELKQRCLDSTALQKLIGDVEGLLKMEHPDFQLTTTPASHLESLVSCLIQKCEEADVQVSLSKEDFASKVVELTSMQAEVQQLNALCLQHESELIVLRESLHQAEEALLVARSEIQGKGDELEQSEQRVSSLREKLTIAVTKGKGLIVQRDGLKQSLNEKSAELERFSQELQMKDARLLEIETKLQAYSESGERVEALESELSYIRNSATALRESFLLKDSVLQRIEEILEDLDLPEHFHSRDIIEKIDWLARTATNTFPVTDSDQKSSAGGGSYSYAGFVATESWKDDVQPSSDSSEDIKKKYDELQSKFYGLAEQNEMLEQSLMERNNIIQRWEELLDRIDMPSHLRSVEPEDRIDWLRKALSEVQEDNMSLQQKVVNLENHCLSLTADLEDSQRRVADLEADLQTFIHERDHLSGRLEALVNDWEKLSTKTAEFELENEKLQKEVTDLQENVAKMHGNENQILSIEADLRRLEGLITDALEISGSKFEYSGGSSIDCLEGLLNKLLESYEMLSLRKPVHGGAAESLHTGDGDETVVGSRSLNTLDSQESDIDVLKKELEEVQHELLDVKEERDVYLEKQQSMTSEFEALHKKVNELQALLNQEEQKSASVREKLNVAVRKGKSLIQHRDSLKQSIEEVNSEVERLRSEIKMGQVKIAEYEQTFMELSTYPGRVEALESETLFLRNCLNQTEQNLQQKANTLNMIVNILDKIDVGGDINSRDPVLKLEQVEKMCVDLRADVTSSEQEARKSKRAAELLLAELNEVQERNDGLQEELANSVDELSVLSKEMDLAVVGKLEAVSSLEKLSTAQSKERKNQFSEFAGLKSGVDQLRMGFHDISNSLAGLFYNELEFLNNLESGIDSILNLNSANVVDVHPFTAAGGFLMSNSNKDNSISMDPWSDPNLHGNFDENFVIETFTYTAHYLQELKTDINGLKEKLDEHSMSLHNKTGSISRLVGIVHGEITSKKESLEALRRDFLQMEVVKKEKDKELLVLHRNAALLFEACTSSVVKINRRKAELVGNSWAVGDLGMTSKTTEFPSLSGEGQLYSEESVRSLTDRLLSAANDFASLTAEIVESSQKEMKLTISNLQKELQEKDVQKERIFMELVSQIKEAEATASSYSEDLESSKTLVHDMEKQLEAMRGERNVFEQRVKELEGYQGTSDELRQRIRSLTDVLAAKDHEIEELMQALDEEEVQMQGITSKIKELEKIVEQKNLELENLKASRGKVMRKLSITVNKFDELHHLSASLLAEVEKLQSQLQDRDAEISFLRQEVTRCTNDVLVASQVSNKGSSDEIHELLTWFNINIARFGVHSEYLEDKNNSDVPEQKEVLKKTIDSILSELGDLRASAQRKDILLQEERTKVEELTHKGQTLEKSLREKESRLNLLAGVEDDRATSSSSEIHEVEPAINKWAASGSSIASQVRSLRKGNSEQVAIAIDMDPGSTSRLEDEDEDKVHGFKSLTTSRMIPRFTRPVTDMIDGLWVSCDRTLMRQPILRLGIIFYWAFLHALLASLAI